MTSGLARLALQLCEANLVLHFGEGFQMQWNDSHIVLKQVAQRNFQNVESMLYFFERLIALHSSRTCFECSADTGNCLTALL